MKELPPAYSDGKLYLYVDKSKITQTNSTFAVTLNTSGLKTYYSGQVLLKTDGSAGYSVKEPLQIGPDQTPADIKVNLSGTFPAKGKLREAQICFTEYTQCADADWKPWKSITKDKMTFSAKQRADLGISKTGKFKIRIFVERPTAKKNGKKVVSQLRTYDSVTVKHQTRYDTSGRVQDVVIDVGLAGLEIPYPGFIAYTVPNVPRNLVEWQEFSAKTRLGDRKNITEVSCVIPGLSEKAEKIVKYDITGKESKLDLLEKGCVAEETNVSTGSPIIVKMTITPPAGSALVTSGDIPTLLEIDKSHVLEYACTPGCVLQSNVLRIEGNNLVTLSAAEARGLESAFNETFSQNHSDDAKNILKDYQKNKLIVNLKPEFQFNAVNFIINGNNRFGSWREIQDFLSQPIISDGGLPLRQSKYDPAEKDYFYLVYHSLVHDFSFGETSNSCKEKIKLIPVHEKSKNTGDYMCRYWSPFENKGAYSDRFKDTRPLWAVDNAESCGYIANFMQLVNLGKYPDMKPKSYALYMIDNLKTGKYSSSTSNFAISKDLIWCRNGVSNKQKGFCGTTFPVAPNESIFDDLSIYKKYTRFIMYVGNGYYYTSSQHWSVFLKERPGGNIWVLLDHNSPLANSAHSPQLFRFELSAEGVGKAWQHQSEHPSKKDDAGKPLLAKDAWLYIYGIKE